MFDRRTLEISGSARVSIQYCRRKMKRLRICVVVTLGIFSTSIAAPEKIERKATTEFSPDQIAIYSYLLKSYRTLVKPTYRDMLAQAFYLEGETEPFEMKELELGRGCLKGIDLEVLPKEEIPTMHRLLEQTWLPSDVKSADEVKCLDAPKSTSQICWQTEGALSLTEILFDKSHTHALVGFGVGCGMECGWGEIAILEKVAGHWRRQAVCEEWYI